jgi:uncharacterized protein (TIGR02466 family)
MYEIPLPSGFRDHEAFNRSLTEELEKYHTRKVEPYDQTLRGGTQTMGELFDIDFGLVRDARNSISEAVRQYIRDLPDDPLHPTARRKNEHFKFAGSWSCRLHTSGFHTNHVHPKGWISSAYYVSLPSAIEKTRQNEGWIKFGESSLQAAATDRPESFVKPQVGRLVLFPSFFWHGTVPFTSSENRVTIAFDVVPE